jgi:hypothetical protein
MELYEFEGVLDPKYLNLESLPEEKRVEFFADTVRDIMASCLKVPKSDSGYRHC